jgi:hypothetical protein
VGFETALALNPYVSLLRDVIIILIGGFSKKLGVLELGECRGVKPLCRGYWGCPPIFKVPQSFLGRIGI